MEELDLLIQKFWAGQTTESENIRLKHILNNDSDDILLGFESTEAGHMDVLEESSGAELLEALHGRLNLETKKTKVIERPLDSRINRHYWIAAASVLLVLASMFLVFRFAKNPEKQMAETAVTEKPGLVNVVNSSDSMMVLSLSDNSVIRLSPKSAITYYKPFVSGRRDISLVGTAEFDVAKDALRPFTVYTGRLSTTALGTKFKIDAASQNKFVKVKLMEGKVVLRSTGMKDVYLMPGQQCKFEIATGYAKVSPFDNEDQKYGINGLKKTSLNPNKTGSLAFVQKPLSVVFEKIGEQFNVKIESSDVDINSISFTGTFFPSDSLANVLTIICGSNDLSFERKQNIITIKKANK